MTATKTEGFSPEILELAKIMKALGHPARLAILQLLIERQACICGSIVEALPLSQATVSQHLAALKEAGLIKGVIDGPKVCYCIDEGTWARAQQTIQSFIVETRCC
jgi:DNA-binding transcriptional ArsR family regulator